MNTIHNNKTEYIVDVGGVHNHYRVAWCQTNVQDGHFKVTLTTHDDIEVRFYVVVWIEDKFGDNGTWKCNCPGFDNHGHCKHVTKMMPEYPPVSAEVKHIDIMGILHERKELWENLRGIPTELRASHLTDACINGKITELEYLILTIND